MSGTGRGLPIPVPIAHRIREAVPTYRALQLLLDEWSFENYRDALHSRDPYKLKDIVFPLERAFVVAANLSVELVAEGLRELHIVPIDGPRDLAAFAEKGVITERLALQLIDIHRVRNETQHEHPDIRAATIYPACEELLRILPAFFRSYTHWLREIGYAAPDV